MAPASPAICGGRGSRGWRWIGPTARTATAGASPNPSTPRRPPRPRLPAGLWALPALPGPRSSAGAWGVGSDPAAILLGAAGDNPHRLRNEAAWAHLCGVAPIEASSGKVTRYRLNRGGNRQANSALYRIVITRMASDPRTRRYVERRTEEGRSKAEIIR